MINIKRTVATEETKPASWTELKEHAVAGKLEEVLHSGDTIDIALKSGENVTLMVGKDQNGTVYFTSKNCLTAVYRMTSNDKNSVGWAETEMRRFLNEEVFALLPDDLQAVIKPTRIVQIVNFKRVEVEDKLFCFSATQVFGDGFGSSKEPEDSRIDIFEKKENRMKLRKGEPEWWWLRTVNYSSHFRSVSDGGYYTNDAPYCEYGVVIGFTI